MVKYEYIKTKNYHYVRGILYLLLLLIMLLVPFINIGIAWIIYETGRNNPKQLFWEEIFYDVIYKKEKIKKKNG